MFFLLILTIFSPKEGEFVGSPFHDYNIWSFKKQITKKIDIKAIHINLLLMSH
jgi:hypothetical protein